MLIEKSHSSDASVSPDPGSPPYTIVADAVPAPPKPPLAVLMVGCVLHALPSYNSVKLDPAPGGVLPPAIIKKVDVPFLLAATPNPLVEDKFVPAVQEVPS